MNRPSRSRPGPWHLCIALVVAGCGTRGQVAEPDALLGQGDTAIDAMSFVPAPHPALASLVSDGGPVLVHPKIKLVFFAGDDAMQAQIEQFTNELAASDYWTQTTTEYGVGSLAVLPTVVTSDAVPASFPALDTWLASRFDGSHPEWGAFDPEAMYSVFLPAGAALNGPACNIWGAYHDEVRGHNGESIIVALMPRCDFPGITELDQLTLSASHEWIEGAADPRYVTDLAYGDIDPDHYVWTVYPKAEVGDLCWYLGSARRRLVGQFLVQRTWSSAAAAAGHDPCIPAPDSPYVGAAPQLDDTVLLAGPYGSRLTQGAQVSLGATKTIDLALWSDAPADDFEVSVVNTSVYLEGKPRELQLELDRTTGHNGDTLHLTMTRIRNGEIGGSELLIQTEVAGVAVGQYWMFVAN